MKAIATKQRQQGITLMSFIIVLAVLGFFGFMAAKLWGPYYEFMNVKKAMSNVATDPGAGQQPIGALHRALQKRFDVGYVDTIAATEAKLIKDKSGNTLNMNYEVRVPFIYNIDFVVKFDNTVALDPKNTSGE